MFWSIYVHVACTLVTVRAIWRALSYCLFSMKFTYSAMSFIILEILLITLDKCVFVMSRSDLHGFKDTVQDPKSRVDIRRVFLWGCLTHFMPLIYFSNRKNRKPFFCFHLVEKETSGIKWVNESHREKLQEQFNTRIFKNKILTISDWFFWYVYTSN